MLTFLAIAAASLAGGVVLPDDPPPAKACAPAGVGDEQRQYAGRTEAEWQVWMKSVDLAGPEAADAADELAHVASDPAAPPMLRKAASLTLGRIEAAADVAAPLFATLLADAKPTALGEAPRSWALKGIALQGPRVKDLAPRVVEILRAPETGSLDRLLAMEALGRIGGAHRATLPALVEVLETGGASTQDGPGPGLRPEQMRTTAADVLSLFGASASPAIDALLRAARDDHEPLRRAAVTTLGATGNPLVLDPLADVLMFDDSPAVQDAAAAALSRFGTRAVPVFRGMLAERASRDEGRASSALDAGPSTLAPPNETSVEMRVRAAEGLGMIGADAMESVAELSQSLDDEAGEVRIAAAAALWRITGKLEPSLETAAALLADPSRTTRMRAHRLLVDMGREGQAGKVSQRLESLVESPDPRVRQAAYITLRELSQAGEDRR